MDDISTIPALSEPNALLSDLRSPLTEIHWYAAYTCANREKKVAAELEKRSVEAFLPLYNSLRRWKDRRVRLDLPLFPNYVFVHLQLAERLRVLQVPGVVRLVGFSSAACPVPEIEIARIRNILDRGVRTEPHPYLTAGRRVRVKTGPLSRYAGDHRATQEQKLVCREY